MRERARAEGRTRLYDGLWRDRDPSEAPAGMKPTIRLKAPQTGETVIDDQVQGRVVWQNENSTTSCCCVAMATDLHACRGGRRSRHGVTHVIRGDDHLINAAPRSRSTMRFPGRFPACRIFP